MHPQAMSTARQTPAMTTATPSDTIYNTLAIAEDELKAVYGRADAILTSLRGQQPSICEPACMEGRAGVIGQSDRILTTVRDLAMTLSEIQEKLG